MQKIEELQSNKALSVLARSLFTQIFCEFDAFMGALLKTIYLRNTVLLKGIAREISLTDLLEYQSIDAVKKVLLDKEIETFRRDSYIEQFIQLEKKFVLPLRKFPEWGEFVELGQRRNIFTHNDGLVSDQYLQVCDREGHTFLKRPKNGESLDADIKYFSRAVVVLSKVGFMLAHTLWSKLFPAELEQLDSSMTSTIFNYLQDKRWRTAGVFAEFSMSEPMRKNISEREVRIRVINLAIALKFSDRQAEVSKLLASFDWTASYRDFKLAILILEDKFEEAKVLMETIGKAGELLTQEGYHTWPHFTKFRERPDFYVTYEKIYGEPYLTNLPSDTKQPNVSLVIATANVGVSSPGAQKLSTEKKVSGTKEGSRIVKAKSKNASP